MSPERRILLAVLAVLVVWVALDVRRRGRLDPERISSHRTDLTAYTTASGVLLDGGTAESAYSTPGPRGWRYQYMPLLAVLLMPIARMRTDVQSLLFGLLSVAVAWGIYLETKRWLAVLRGGSRGDDPPWLAAAAPIVPWYAWTALGTVALPALNTMQRGQVNLLVLLPLMWGFRQMWCGAGDVGARPRPVLGGTLLAFPAVLKFIPFLPAGYALLLAAAAWCRAPSTPERRRAGRRMWLGGAGFCLGLGLFAVVLPAAIIGWERNLDGAEIFLRGVVTNEDFSDDWGFNIHSKRNQGLANAMYLSLSTVAGEREEALDGGPTWLDRTPAFGRASTVIRGGLLGLFLLVSLWYAPVLGRTGAFVAFGLACAAALVVSPVSWGHHFVSWLPGLLAVPALAERAGRPRAARWFGIAPVVLVAAHYIAMNLSAPLGVLGYGLTAWWLGATAFLVVVARGGGRSAAADRAPAPESRR